MLYRVIIRISYTSANGGTSTALRNEMAGHLQAAGLVNSKTGTWESPGLELSAAATCLGAVLSELAEYDLTDPAHLKLLWAYIDGPINEVESVGDVLMEMDDND